MAKFSGSIPVIDEFNEHQLAPEYAKNGYMARDWQETGYGSVFQKRSFPLIPRNEWKDRIEERRKAGALASQHFRRAGVKVKFQTIPFCWIFAPVNGLMIKRLMEGQQHKELSPASCGSRITGFRERGGWGIEALKGLQEMGTNETKDWPDNAVSRKYLTEENIQSALNFRIDEIDDLERGDYDGLASALLNGFVCPLGIDRWGHEVLAMDLVEDGILILNSHGENYGDRGMAVLTEGWISSRGSFDAEVIRSASASK
jgi:hypothetical protein